MDDSNFITKFASKTKDGAVLFNYNNLEIKISPQTKSLFVFIKPDHLNLETLFELEGLTHWLQSHIEVQSVILTSEQEVFSLSPKMEDLSRWTPDSLRKFQQKLARVVWSLHKVPQTVVTYVKRGCDSFGIELALAGDIIVMDRDGEWDFNYLTKGLVPMSGAISILSNLVGVSRARRWLKMSKVVKSSELESSGLVELIDDKDEIVSMLNKINEQSSVCRIQMKRQWLEAMTSHFEKIEDVEYPFALAAHDVADYQRPHKKEDFISAKELANQLKNKAQETIV